MYRTNLADGHGIAQNIPYWELWVTYYGPMEVIDAQWQATQRHFAKIEGATFKVVDRLKLPVDVEGASSVVTSAVLHPAVSWEIGRPSMSPVLEARR